MDVNRNTQIVINDDLLRKIVYCIEKAIGDDLQQYLRENHRETNNAIILLRGDNINTNLRTHVVKDIASYPTDLKYYQFLKNKWKVSIQAMIYRTHQLGIMSDNQYQYLMRQVSKNGWRIKEPGDVPYSLNENIFQGAIDLLIEQNVLTAKEILDLFKKNGVTLYPEDMEELLHLRPDTLKVEEKVVPILQLRKK